MNFNKGQITLIVAAFALILALYFLGQRKSNTSAESAMPENMPMTATLGNEVAIGKTELNIDQLADNIKSKIDKKSADSITYWQKQADNSANVAAKTKALKKIAEIWDKEKYIEISAHYYQQLAKADSTRDNWLTAGSKLADAFSISGDSTMRMYLIENAIDAYQKTLKFDTSQIEVKVNLANCYFEGYQNVPQMVMKGVMMLREVTAVDSANVQANLSLGRMSVVSGQFDKALLRFQTVIRADSTNAEAYYYLGEAYAAIGQKEKAREAFEKCKSLIKNPTFANQLDEYIKQL